MTADDTTPDPLAATLTEAARYAALHRALGRGTQIVHIGRGDAPGATLTVDMLDQLIIAAGEPRHETSCPACGATIRARMADAEGGDGGVPDPAIEEARARGRARQQVVPNDHPDWLAAQLGAWLDRERYTAREHAYAAAQVGALRERIAALPRPRTPTPPERTDPMPIDEYGREYQTLDEFMATTDPAAREPDTSAENVARAVRFLEAWLPVGARDMGEAAHGDVLVLMEFARQQLRPGSVTTTETEE